MVHNGIIENFESLRARLQQQGYRFVTQTDTEVIVHLIHAYYDGDLLPAVRKAVAEFRGAYAIAAISTREPGRIVGARAGSPLLVGVGEHDHYLASDASALAPVTQRVAYLEEGDVADIRRESYAIYDADGTLVTRQVVKVKTADAVELGPFRHYMQKEIFEQPRAVADTLESVGGIEPALFGPTAADVFSSIDAVHLLACGTSYYAAMVARLWLEGVARIPAQAEIASEYRYRDSVPDPKALIVVVSQSGETADTLAALSHAKKLGQRHTLAICNVATSSMIRQTELTYLTRAGTEIGVASTKAFTTQLTALFLLVLSLAKSRGRLGAEDEARWLRDLRHLPSAIQSVLALEPAIIAWAEQFAKKQNALFLGRGLHYPDCARGRAQAQGNLVHPRRGLSRGRAQARATCAGRFRACRSSPSRPTTRCWKSSSPTCRKSVPAAASFMSLPTPTAISRRAMESTYCACPNTRACCRLSCIPFRCSCSRITPRSCATPTSTSRAISRSR